MALLSVAYLFYWPVLYGRERIMTETIVDLQVNLPFDVSEKRAKAQLPQCPYTYHDFPIDEKGSATKSRPSFGHACTFGFEVVLPYSS